jgi:hypothetical protein
MSDLDALLERLEKATGPDREIDAAIYDALAREAGRVAFKVKNWSTLPGSRLSRYHDGWLIGKASDDEYADDLPLYTASIDAAFALVERVLPGAFWHIAKGRLTEAEPMFGAELLFGWDQSLGKGEGPTAPLAILAATLSALRTQESQDDHKL